MSATLPEPSLTAPTPYKSPWQRWKEFWFHPSDPTTLGFIRVTTGLLVLYIHLAYSFDLQAFFGEHGWYAARFIERERHESPYFAPPVFEKWEDAPPVNPQLSDFPHRRAALMQYFRALPGDPGERAATLAYLNRLVTYQNAFDIRLALEYVQRIQSQHELEKHLTVLNGGKATHEKVSADGKREPLDVTQTYASATPEFFMAMSPEQKVQLTTEIRAFWHSLAKINWTYPDRDRNFVFNHFVEVGPDARKSLVEYLNTLPADDAERAKLLDYLEYWNSDPRKALRTGAAIFSLWFHVTDPTQMALLHAGVLVLIVLFTVGLFTRVTSVLVWLATVSYIHRTQQVLFGMDTMMNILLFYLMIGNSGAALSVDRLIARYRAVRASLRRTGTIDANTRAFLAWPPPSVSAGFAIRLIQIHFCFIYAAAGLAKLKGAMWWNGQAFWEVVVNPEFTLMQYQWYENSLRWLGSIKPVYYFMTASAVWLTLFIEIATPFLLWTRLRWLMILLAAAMHAAIGVLMGLNLFELLMIVMLIAFFPDRVIRDRFRGGPDLPRLSLTFNPQNARHARAAALALAGDVDNQVALAPDPGASAVTLNDPDNKPVTGPDGVTALFKRVRFLSIVGFVLWIPGVRSLLTKYLFPAANSGSPDPKRRAELARPSATR
jgi:hypothetical protein